jgi:hypothetical protein
MLRIRDRAFYFNGERQDHVIARSSFKLANQLTNQYTGRGQPRWGEDSAADWVEFNQEHFGEHVMLRVFLETGDWDPQTKGMFGSPARDEGFWRGADLTDGHREREMTGGGERVLEWFFKHSQETGVAFELDIIATLKHAGIPTGEIDHVIRQVGLQMGRMQEKYPRALILPSACNEANAHSRFEQLDNPPPGRAKRDHLTIVNQWAMRWYRDNYFPGSALIVDDGGGDTFQYDIGPQAYHALALHPLRSGRDWEQLPPNMNALRSQAGAFPVIFTESMYYVEREDRARVEGPPVWYRNRSGYTHDFAKWARFTRRARGATALHCMHDEKGAQCDRNWPRPQTRVEAEFGKGGGVLPPPPPEPEPEPEVEERLKAIEDRLENLEKDRKQQEWVEVVLALAPVLTELIKVLDGDKLGTILGVVLDRFVPDDD